MKKWIISLIRKYRLRYQKWIIDYLDDDEVVYIGWIIARRGHIDFFKRLGVRGPMEWREDPNYGILEKCIITKDVARKLKSHSFMLIGESTFTGFDKYGKQVSWGGEDFE